jgi:small subunit ribosomal protein S20
VANTRSSEKRYRQAEKRRARNSAVKNSVRTLVKKAREAIIGGDAKKAKDALHAATVALDRASSAGVLHANNAQRRVARLAHSVASKFKAAAK